MAESEGEYSMSKPRFLTEKQANRRRNQFVEGSIHYKLQLLLNKGEEYSGVVQLEFNLSHVNGDTFIDYQGDSIEKIILNNELIPASNNSYSTTLWNGLFVKLPTQYLNNGKNTLTIVFSNEYANDGCGLHSFEDTDQKQYLYSQGEPSWCSKMFPCFDQPDMKATLEASIVAPNGWLILSNELKSVEAPFTLEAYSAANPTLQFIIETFEGVAPNEYHFAVFRRTQLYPTYLFGFAAGPYAEIKCEAPYNNIPMSLYSRESLIPHLQKLSDFIFEVTIESMKLYEELFGYPYPYYKYDSVFCPEFNAGAMENTGLVTFNDLYVFREERPAQEYTSFANTITHELSHHWFGNLVTMKWWNDLWLNESFADFISHYILTKMNLKSKQLINIWVEFNGGKSWGYRTDQLNTTHPIATAVDNTEVADSIFDGISYSKGSATLRQLVSLMGEKPFSDALKKYFKKFEFKNAVLDDLIEFFDQEFKQLNLGFSLHEWQKSWIQTAGLNECQPVFDPNSRDVNAELKIIQTAALPEHPTLRKHKIQVAFFDENAQITSIPVLLNESTETIVTYDASKTEYKAVLLNYGDWGFIKVLLDNESISFLSKNLHKVDDILTRTLIWRAFFDMVRDGKLSSEEYVNIFIDAIPLETSDEIINAQLSFLKAVESFTPKQYKKVLSQRIFKFLLGYLLSQPEEKADNILSIRNSLIGYARDDADIAKLVAWFNGEDKELEKVEIGLSNQWKIVSLAHKTSQFTKEQKKAIFSAQAARDSSDTCTNYEYLCKALDVNVEEREELWLSYLQQDNELSVRKLSYSFSGFNGTFHDEDLVPYYDKFFNVILSVFDTQPSEIARQFYATLLPASNDQEKLINSLNSLLIGLDEKYVFLNKLIKESIDDTKRKQRAHACFNSRAPLAQANQ